MVKCDYCGHDALLISGQHMYPHRPDLFEKYFWRCIPCRAWVGCHGKGQTPLGRLANAELRQAKQYAHNAFDRMWKSGKMSRGQAYRWLADRLDISVENCHIGMFDLDRCRKVQEICQEKSQ